MPGATFANGATLITVPVGPTPTASTPGSAPIYRIWRAGSALSIVIVSPVRMLDAYVVLMVKSSPASPEIRAMLVPVASNEYRLFPFVAGYAWSVVMLNPLGTWARNRHIQLRTGTTC